MHEQEKDLFAGYEIKNWIITPRIYKIIGASALLNLLAVFVVAQGNLLTRKGCDSPLVGSICQVLDTVYVGSIILGTDSGYVDKEYREIDLGDAEITYIDVSNDSPPLNYPDGYFALANPEQALMMQDPSMTAGAIPSEFGGQTGGFGAFPPATALPPVNNSSADLLGSNPTLPPPVKGDAVIGDLPTSTSGSSSIASYRKPKRRGLGRRATPESTFPDDSPKELPELGGAGKTAENKLGKPKEETKPDDTQTAQASDPVTDVEINKRPIKDLGVFVNDLLAKKEIDLQSDFSVGARGKLNKEGKLDPKTFKYTQAVAADPKMLEVIQQSIEAINASGYLQYLSQLSGKDLSLLLQQDNANLTATVQSELESENRAKSIKSGLDLAISLAKLKKTDPNDQDDLNLLKSATIESKGKQIIIKFAIPKPLAQDMIKRKLLDEAAKASQEQPSGTAQNANANKNAE